MTRQEKLELIFDCRKAVSDLREEPRLSALGAFLLLFLEGALQRLEADGEAEEPPTESD